jgi:adenylate cyclase class IV
LRLGFREVVSAVRAVQKHPDEQTIEVLIDAVQLLGSLPELPIRDRFDAEQLENSPLDLNDEATFDPSQIYRSLSI